MQQYMLQIIEHLEKKGYKKLNPDSNNVYGRAEGDAIYVIVLGNSRNLKADNLIKFNSQIRNDLEETGKRVMNLNLLLTKDGMFDDDLVRSLRRWTMSGCSVRIMVNYIFLRINRQILTGYRGFLKKRFMRKKTTGVSG